VMKDVDLKPLEELFRAELFKMLKKEGKITDEIVNKQAVTERVIETLKYEWLKKVAIIRGYRHLVKLCNVFTEWYNDWRPHEFFGSATPATVFRDKAVPFVLKKRK